MQGTIFRIVALLALCGTACAMPPEACSVVSLDDINAIAGNTIVTTRVHKAGNPSECGFIDAKKAAVIVISIREVEWAAENELQHERENLEKIYRGKVKWLTAVGESGFWMPINKQLVFRKGKTLVSVTFSRGANQNEVDTAQIARMVEAKLK